MSVRLIRTLKSVKIRRFTALVLGLALAQASAITVTGTVEGQVSPDTRISGFAVTAFGQPVQEIVSVPVKDTKFTLEIPTISPNVKAQVALTPQNVSWPGVLDPVTVSVNAQTAELKFYTYRDGNNNGRHDDNEVLREVKPNAGTATLFVAWVNTDVTVTASKGYQASLKRGWNAFLVDVGKAVKVTPFTDKTVVNVRLSR